MRICDRAVNAMHVINAEGDCRVCGWPSDCIIGNLMKDDMADIMHGKKAEEFRNTLLDGSYSKCKVDNCPYLANNNMDEALIDIDKIPDYPNMLGLSYEGVCNYNCTCCTSRKHMMDTRENDYAEQYEKIEEKIKQILPYVKTVSANGRGELFASKRTLKLLSEWRPLASKEEISVRLETNGSLFDERHWKQIENLGQYHLSVFITVMSFQEPIYQHLSGTKLPISQIENNLRFVKKLREEGVIDYLELATVLQEENFREMPEFVKRCINEFGADKVRLRPILPGGVYDKHIQWFMDVRNPEHPYYEQYVEIMKNPIFKDPKVLLWSGNLASLRGKYPGIKSAQIQKMVDTILNDAEFTRRLAKYVGDEDIVLYGLGTVGKVLLQVNNGDLKIKEIYDKNKREQEYKGIRVKSLCKQAAGKTTVVVTVFGAFEAIEKELREGGFSGRIVDIYEVIEQM